MMSFMQQQVRYFADFCKRAYNKVRDGWRSLQKQQDGVVSNEELSEDFLSETPPTVQARMVIELLTSPFVYFAYRGVEQW